MDAQQLLTDEDVADYLRGLGLTGPGEAVRVESAVGGGGRALRAPDRPRPSPVEVHRLADLDHQAPTRERK